MDLFKNEQRIYDHVMQRIQETPADAHFDFKEYAMLAKEYGRLLKQFRKITRFADRTAGNLYESNLELTNKALYDALTDTYNRYFIKEQLERTIKSLSRSGGVLSLMMLDVDYFKKYNDRYGHYMGDACLKAIAEILSGCITREDDFIARYGGEEFIAVLPNTDERGACVMASTMLERIIERGITHEKSFVSNCVTISIGITSAKVKHTHKSENYIKRADEALYMSKKNGRNRYTFMAFEEEENEA